MDLTGRFDATAAYDDCPLSALARGVTQRPQELALHGTGKSLSYLQLRSEIVNLATVLRQRGVMPGDRVAIAGENTVACVALLYATQLLDAWPAILNPRIAHGEVRALQASYAPRLMVFAVDGAPAASTLSEKISGEAELHRYQSAQVGTLVFGPTLEVKSEPVFTAASKQVGLLIFTSGTLGLPKTVMLSLAALANLGRVLAAARMTAAGDTVQGVSPLSHIMGISNFVAAMHAGATLKLMPRLDVAALTAAIVNGEITHLSLVPTVYLRLTEYIESNHIDLSASKLRYISCGGAPLIPALKTRVEALFRVRLINGYGMTECAPALRGRPDYDSPADCVGWPEAGVEARIVDKKEVDTATRSDTVGELWLRSSTMMMGYYGDEVQTAAALRPGGWLATGDLARRLADGSIAIAGRIKEMIIRSGFNVYPAEVEAALSTIPQVVQAGVVGLMTADGDEDIVAFVQLRKAGSFDQKSIQDALRASIAPYKLPTHVVFLDSLPLGITGKIWKSKLKQMAAERFDPAKRVI